MNELKTIRNLPTEDKAGLSSLLQPKTNQVVSMALSNSDNVHITYFAFDNGEAVSKEKYLGDTMYLLIEGETKIEFDEREVNMVAGDVIAVPANVGHAIGGGKAFKVMQITMIED